MNALERSFLRLRNFNASVKRGDAELAEESLDLSRGEALEAAPASAEALEEAIQLESIVLRRERPVLAIKDNETELVFVDRADSEIWTARLTRAKPFLDSAIRAVGRINLQGGHLDWVGTGWLVAENVLVTNRHVAREFAMRNGEGFTFLPGAAGRISANVDFLQEIDNPNMLVFKLIRPLHIEERAGPDMAFFEVEVTGGNPKLALPLDLAAQFAATENVATIGYPAYDSRIPEPDLMERIFGKIYNKKRLAPGAVTRVEETRILHNCTTLGGNSGSVVLDLDTGKAVGLHFSGSFLATNYAVLADIVRRALADLRSGRTVRRETRPARPVPRTPMRLPARSPLRRQGGVGGNASVTIPLTVTLSFGGAPATPLRGYRTAPVAPEPDSAVDAGEEAVAADYRDRTGYDPHFLGRRDFVVDLPSVERDADDVLEFEFEGETETELRYEHYSVVMSCERRMCFFSAVNIDGGLSRKNKRVGWKWDPRIPKAQQIKEECYGDPPKFSRGHMTRREDPGWGTAKAAKRGNEDSMHVTNATPQMQAFNSPIWLELEDYALQHAREDDMKISVFTGPYFTEQDPEMFGVRIPLTFWKIIAFIHDETGKLCATGYEMNQEQSLQPEEEFVFGAFTSQHLNVATQVPIRLIEAHTGISFGRLASVDPLAGAEEGLGDGEALPPLQRLEQIRFV